MLRRLPVLIVLAALGLAGLPAAWAAPLRVGVEPTSDQLSHADATGQPVGFAIDITEAVAQARGLEVEFVMKSWPQLLADFQTGELDILAATVATKEREALLAFSTAHVDLESRLYVHKGVQEPRTLAAIGDLTLGTAERGAGHEYIAARGWTQVRFYSRLSEALEALNRGECDGVLASRLVAKNLIARFRLTNIVETGLEFEDLHYRLRFGVRPEARALLFELNEGLAQLRADGTYDAIYEKWIGPLEPRQVSASDLAPLLAPVIVLVIAVAGAFVWQRRLLRRLARQADQLREGEQRLRYVLEGSSDGFWDTDHRTGHVERSERWAAILGYAKDEVPPTSEGCLRLVHPDDLPGYEAELDRIDRGETDRYDREFRMRAKSGEWRWIHDRGKVVSRDASGAVLRIAGTHTDITERKRTEAALIESQALLKRSAQLLEQTQSISQIGGWEIDLRTDRLYWTRETYRIHETTPEEFAPGIEKAIQFYTPEGRETIAAAVDTVRRDGTPYELELDLITAKQRRVRVLTTGAAEKDGDRVVKIYGTFRDITAEKRAERDREKLRLKMLEAQKLESLGVLAGGIAHDFNNLLTVILANATFVRTDGGNADERLAHIESAARRAADLCRQMLAYAGKGSFVVERVDVGALVQDTAHLIRVSISKKANLDLALTPHLPSVDADASQIRQVVMNLVINASEALGDRPGDIRLRTRLGRPEGSGGAVHSFDLPPGDSVCIEISDTGHGMTPQTLARIFDPFFTTKFAGRGLGLAAVLGIIRAHHGALTVESTLGQGSTFRIYLPVTTRPLSPQSAHPLPPRPAAARGSGTILIADDEPVVLATADALLRFNGYETVLANDGHEAVNQFRAQPHAFSAVLLDLTMPGLDGAEVLRAIRVINPGVRVLIMSGYSEQDVFARLRGLGEAAILRKPFTQQTLLTRIAEVIRS